MKRALDGGLVALVMASIGLFWLQGRAEVEANAPPASAPAPPSPLPTAVAGDMTGPEPPEATELSREQRRFARYDRDRDGRISRTELLAPRGDVFRKLDTDGNNLLTFEEWAGATVQKFSQADINHDDWLTPAEFRSTAPPPPKPKPKCSCDRPKREAKNDRHRRRHKPDSRIRSDDLVAGRI